MCVCARVCFQRAMGEAMSRRIRGVFNAANFWAIVLYNVLSLNSLEFATLVGGRLVLSGRRSPRCFRGMSVKVLQVIQVMVIQE